VPTLSFFSWALAALGKNASVVRVSRGTREAAALLFKAVGRARATVDGTEYTGQALLRSTCVVYYPSENESLNAAMSLAADARVAWGGPDAIEAISRLPRLEHCEDVVFGPKFSLAVLDAAGVADATFRRCAVQSLAREVVTFEQRACSSPQVLFVESKSTSPDSWSLLLDELAAELAGLAKRNPKQTISEATTAEIVRARANYGLREDAAVRASVDVSFTLLADAACDIPPAIQDRTLFVKFVPSLRDLMPLISPKIQTIGVAIADSDVYAMFVEGVLRRGVSRCVPLGQMNLYETPWDGMKPVARLVRYCRA
jgi:hypothetical protein